MLRTGRAAALSFFALIFALLVLFPAAIQLVTDWMWFREIGFERVFSTELGTKALMFVVFAALGFLFLFINLRLAQRGMVPDPVLIRFNPQAPQLDLTGTLRRLALPVSGFVGLLVGLSAMSGWMVLLQFLERGSFGLADPIFGRDLGYYVFMLPALAAGVALLLALTVVSLIFVVPLYWLRGDLLLPPRKVRVEPSAGMHMGVLLTLFFVLTAAQIWLVRIPDLLYSTTGPLRGASYADLHAQLPGLRILAIVSLLAGLFILVGAVRGRLVWHATLAGAAYIIVSLLGVTAYPAIVQRVVVAPTELTRESPQIAHHLLMTRRAWGIDDVQTRDIGADATITLATLNQHSATVENVRLWDKDPLLQTFQQLQELRPYYDFLAIDDDRYIIDGRYRQVLLSARELNPASLPTRSFINEHLTFTHGMGVALSPVNEVMGEGLPVLFIRDLPPVSDVDLQVTRPQIYFGELTHNFIFVHTLQREFDYPAGEENVFTRYGGTAGIPVRNVFRRALFAARFGSTKVLLSGDITNESRVLFTRNINDRARRALPFLRFDNDPYIAIDSEGHLKWIMDAYTSTTRYPYSQRLQDGTNYMRNSVKVVIDAYNGTVDAYIADPDDPIIAVYDRIFPGILQPIADMPPGLRAHVRYPEDLYRLQVALYQDYHMREPELFYHREDQWQIPTSAQRRQDLFMRRIVMRLPDEAREEFIFMTPFTPRQRDNLAAWMVARSDGEHYGELRVYRFPKQSLIFGPLQIVNRINQDTEIARQISLWDQRGSAVIRGELMVIPIEESLVYVQPLYLRAEGGRIPELKRVIVAYQNRVVMEETLDDGLTLLFGGRMDRPRPALAASDPATAPTPGLAAAAPATEPTSALPVADRELMRRAREHFDRAIAAQRAGNWTLYGTEIERLGEVLRRLDGNAGANGGRP